jgi:hypothetical protein
MKHLKKFNEELEPSTYLTASRKLKKLGHERRSKSLEDWGRAAEKRVSMEKWKKKIQEYSPWGKSTFKFMLGKKEEFRGDFYLILTFDDYAHFDSIPHMKETSKGYFSFNINFALGLIPADEETLQKCISKFPDPYFGNGFFWGNWVNINYKVENEKLSFSGVSYNPYDEGQAFSPELVDRRGALTLKKSLMDCLDEDVDYPSSDNRYQTMHDLVFRCICQQCELLVDYNLDMERMLNDVKGYSHNYFFKD